MTAVALPGGTHPLLALIGSIDQVDEWATRLPIYRLDGHRLLITHTRDRRSEAEFLASGLSADTVPLGRLGRLEPQLSRGDLILTLASPNAWISSAACPAAEPLASLHRLIHSGVEIWGITGRRPNSVTDHCHDSIAVPDGDPGMVWRSHQLIAQLLIRRGPLPGGET